MADAQLPNCNQEVFDHGVSVGLFVIPKETAEAICLGISAATGARVDWHYIAGRVHIKALPATPSPPVAPPATPEYPPLPPRRELGMGLMYEPVEGFNADDMRAFVDADRAARTAQPQPQPAQPLTGAGEPYGQVTTHAKTGQQFFYRWPEPPYLDNASECVYVYLKESSDAPNPRSNDQGHAQDGRPDAGPAGRESGPGADQHHEHRTGQPDRDGAHAERDCGGDGVHGACDVSQEVKATAQPQPQPAQPLTGAQEEALRLLFKDAMDWGRSYGQSRYDDITTQDVSQGFAELAKRALTAPSTPTPPTGEKS